MIALVVMLVLSAYGIIDGIQKSVDNMIPLHSNVPADITFCYIPSYMS